MSATEEPARRYYIVQREGDLYVWGVHDTVLGRRVRDADGYEARFLTEGDARACVPANETQEGITWA